jgi:hypothetical protein
MATQNLGIALILSARNQASAVFNTFFTQTQNKLQTLKQTAMDVGKGIAEIMAAKKGLDMLQATTDAYGDLEAAGNKMKAAMMQKGGMFDARMYEQIFQWTKKISAQYAGSATEYMDMVRTLKQNRLSEKDILGGVGDATAKLAMAFDNMNPAAIGEFAAHMRNDMNVGAKQMGQVMNTVLQAKNIGIGKTGEEAVTEINQYVSKVSLGMRNLNYTGLQASKEAIGLGAVFMNMGQSGQTVGTNLRRVFGGIASGETMAKVNQAAMMFNKHLQFFDKKHQFLGIQNFVEQLDKLKGLNSAAIEMILKPFGGKRGLATDMVQFLSHGGLELYMDNLKRMNQGGTLDEQIKLLLQGQKMQEAIAKSNLTNSKASIGQALARPYQHLLSIINKTIIAVGRFADMHPRITKAAGEIVAFATASLALGGAITLFKGLGSAMKLLGVVGPLANVMGLLRGVQFGAYAVRYYFMTGLIPAIGKVGVAFRAMGAAMLANPVGLIIAGVVALGVAAYLVVRNWSSIKGFFADVWAKTKVIFTEAAHWIKQKLIAITPHWILNAWKPVKAFFAGLWHGITGIVAVAAHAIKWTFLNLTPIGIIYKHWTPVSHFFKGLWDLVSVIFKGTAMLVARALYRFTGAELVVKHWAQIKHFFGTIWTGVKEAFITGIGVVKSYLLNMTPVGLIYRNWAPISHFFRNVWDRVKSTFSAVYQWVWNFGSRFAHAGKHIVESIIDGIFGRIGRLGDAMSRVAAKIRAYLPFSPAKEGALRDINRVRLIETIAESIKAAPLISAIARVMHQARAQMAGLSLRVAMRPRMLPVMAGLGLIATQGAIPASAIQKNSLDKGKAIGMQLVTKMQPAAVLQGQFHAINNVAAINGAAAGRAWSAGVNSAVGNMLSNSIGNSRMDLMGNIGFDGLNKRALPALKIPYSLQSGAGADSKTNLPMPTVHMEVHIHIDGSGDPAKNGKAAANATADAFNKQWDLRMRQYNFKMSRTQYKHQ